MTLALIFIWSGLLWGQEDETQKGTEIFKQQLQNTKVDSVKIRLNNSLATKYLELGQLDSSKVYSSRAIISTGKGVSQKTNEKEILQFKKLRAQAIEIYGRAILSSDPKRAVDTLKTSLKLWKEISNRHAIAEGLFYLGIAYSYTGNNEKSIKAYNDCLKLLEDVEDEVLKAMALYYRSLEERYLSNYGDALESGLKSLKIAQKLKDTILMTTAMLSNGFNYMLAKRYPEALVSQKEALKIFKLQNDVAGEATVYNDMGVTSIMGEHYNEALGYHKNALQLRKKINDIQGIGISYAYIALSHKRMGNYEEALLNGKEALIYHLKMGDLRFIADTHINLGDNYLKLEEYNNAIESYKSALDIARKTDDLGRHALCLMLMGETYRNAGNLKKAISKLQEADQIVLPNDYKVRLELYEILTETYVRDNDFRNAFQTRLKYEQIKDSLATVEKSEKIEKLKQQLIFENKEALQKASQDKQIAIQESQLSKQKLIRNLSIFGLLVGTVLAYIFFRRFKEKRRLNLALEKSIVDLKDTQKQLIQSEKMASLGELTAGIAHEIQNPLNFVNNFSEVSTELLVEMNEEIAKGNLEEAKLIAVDIKQNLEKINHHGKRADSIVKGMLQYSRNSSGQKEPTDINALADEYLRLAYHGLRAKDKNFNASLETDFDESIGLVNVIKQDMGRVILNLITNAFYATDERKKSLLTSESEIKKYEPTVSVSTKQISALQGKEGRILISVKDNGNGIPKQVVDKIFKPFFTTKPTGQGTGLGLSMSYDIIKKGHGGSLKVVTEDGKGTEFIIELPLTQTVQMP